MGSYRAVRQFVTHTRWLPACKRLWQTQECFCWTSYTAARWLLPAMVLIASASQPSASPFG